MEKDAMNGKLQEQVFKRDNWRCVYCDYDGSKSHDDWERGNLCVDHEKPRLKGGTDAIENLRTACRSCNAYEGENWFPTLEAARRWLRLYRESISRPWFDYHVAGTIPRWDETVWGPRWDRLKQEVAHSWQLYNEEKASEELNSDHRPRFALQHSGSESGD
jgi:hypothetical protein